MMSWMIIKSILLILFIIETHCRLFRDDGSYVSGVYVVVVALFVYVVTKSMLFGSYNGAIHWLVGPDQYVIMASDLL